MRKGALEMLVIIIIITIIIIIMIISTVYLRLGLELDGLVECPGSGRCLFMEIGSSTRLVGPEMNGVLSSSP